MRRASSVKRGGMISLVTKNRPSHAAAPPPFPAYYPSPIAGTIRQV